MQDVCIPCGAPWEHPLSPYTHSPAAPRCVSSRGCCRIGYSSADTPCVKPSYPDLVQNGGGFFPWSPPQMSRCLCMACSGREPMASLGLRPYLTFECVIPVLHPVPADFWQRLITGLWLWCFAPVELLLAGLSGDGMPIFPAVLLLSCDREATE